MIKPSKKFFFMIYLHKEENKYVIPKFPRRNKFAIIFRPVWAKMMAEPYKI